MAGRDIVAHDLSHYGDTSGIQRRCARIGTGASRLGDALELAEQIELIADRKPCVGEVHYRDLFLQRQ